MKITPKKMKDNLATKKVIEFSFIIFNNLLTLVRVNPTHFKV